MGHKRPCRLRMGWTGRAPAPNRTENERGAKKHEEHIAMSHKTAAAVAQTIGIDTGKNTLHLIGLDDKGAIVLREKIARGRIAAPARQCAAVLDRNRSWHGDALCGSRAKCARP